MSQHLILIVLGQALLLIASWILLAPDRVLYVFIALMLVPLGLGNAFGQALPAAYLVMPAVTLVYLLERFQRRSAPQLVRGNRNWLWILALALLRGGLRELLAKTGLSPHGIGSINRTPIGIHSWMGFVLSACSFLVFSSVTFFSPARTQKVMGFTARVCLALCVLGFLLVHLQPVQGFFYEVRRAGAVTPYFFSTGGPDLLEGRVPEPRGRYRIGMLDLVASTGLLLVLSSRIRSRRRSCFLASSALPP